MKKIFGFIPVINRDTDNSIFQTEVDSDRDGAESPVFSFQGTPDYALWRKKFLGMIDILTTVSKETEDEFLNVGGSLYAFSSGCSDSSSRAHSAAEMIESGGGLNVSVFKELFEKIYNEIETCATIISDGMTGMTDLMPKIEEIIELRLFLKKLSRSITILGTLIRIESARVEKSEFNVMTNVVDELAEKIAKDTTEIEVSAKEANESIIDTYDKIGPCLEVFTGELTKTRGLVNKILDEIDSVSTQAKLLCNRIGGRAGQITPEIGEVVSAIQFHDISRQQMEHVAEAFEDINKKIEEVENFDDSEKAMLNRWILKALEIQIAQLEYVISETNKAAEGISGHLTRVSDLAEAQADDAGSILEEEETGRDRIGMIGGALESLSGILEYVKEMTDNMIAGLTDVNEKIGRMSTMVEDIEDISDNIDILALNAIIKVASVGDSGRGLGVLAEEIRRLSNNAKDGITTGASVINAILSNSEDLRGTLTANLNDQLASTEDISNQTREAIAKLLKDDETLMQSMNEISSETKRLENEITSLISSITFEGVIRNRLTSILDELHDMKEELKGYTPNLEMDEYNRFTPDLEKLLQRYTMQSERTVHASALTGESADDGDIDLFGSDGSSGGDDGIELFGAGEASEGGDNIELFGSDESSGGGDNIELFGSEDISGAGDNIELFGSDGDESNQPEEETVKTVEREKKKEEENLGDNIELF